MRGNFSQSYSQEQLVIRIIIKTIKGKPVPASDPVDHPVIFLRKMVSVTKPETWHYCCATMCFVHSAMTIFKPSGPWFWQITLCVFNTTMLLNRMRMHCASCPVIWRWRMILVDGQRFTWLNVSIWGFLIDSWITCNMCGIERRICHLLRVEDSVTEMGQKIVVLLWIVWHKVTACKTFPFLLSPILFRQI